MIIFIHQLNQWYQTGSRFSDALLLMFLETHFQDAYPRYLSSSCLLYVCSPTSQYGSFVLSERVSGALSTVGNTCPHSKVMALVCLGCEVKEDLRFIIVSGPLGELQAYQAYHS